MFVTDGARTQLMKDERKRFIDKEWPVIAATIARLGLDAGELLQELDSSTGATGDKND